MMFVLIIYILDGEKYKVYRYSRSLTYGSLEIWAYMQQRHRPVYLCSRASLSGLSRYQAVHDMSLFLRRLCIRP